MEDFGDENVEKVIESTEPVFFSYFSYLVAKVVILCCCCCRSTELVRNAIKKKILIDKAMVMISKEIDVKRLVKANRTADLMKKMLLKTNQSKLIKYFKRYAVDSDEEIPSKKQVHASAKDILSDFQPKRDKLDRLILG